MSSRGERRPPGAREHAAALRLILHRLQKPLGHLFDLCILRQNCESAPRSGQDDALEPPFVEYLAPLHALFLRKQ